MTLLLDTSVLIDHLRGNPAARHAVAAAVHDGERLAASVEVKAEVLAALRPTGEDRTRRLLDALDWLPVDDDMAERAGQLANRYLPSHPGVDPVDHMIAATAELHEAVLWTRNLRQFPMFPDLEPPY